MTSIDLQDSVVTLGILRTLIDCTFFDRRQTQRVDLQGSVAGINLQGYNLF
jgi:hypothetical protein